MCVNGSCNKEKNLSAATLVVLLNIHEHPLRSSSFSVKAQLKACFHAEVLLVELGYLFALKCELVELVLCL